MMESVKNYKEHNIRVVAHPGPLDLQDFGRKALKLLPEELTEITVHQVDALRGRQDVL